jgi:hypothetical protein
MWRKLILATVLAAFCAAIAAAQGAAKFLTNDDVVAMVKDAQSEDSILNAIQTQGTDFDVSAKALLALKKSGVSKKIIDAMIGAVKDQKEAAAAVISSAQAKAAAEDAEDKADAARAEATRQQRAAATNPSPTNPAGMMAVIPGMPTVTMVQNGQKQALAVAHTQIVPTNAPPASIDNLAADNGLGQNLGSLSRMMLSGGMPGMGGGSGMGGMPGLGGLPGLGGKSGSKLGMASTLMMANPMIGPAFMAGSLFMKHKAAQQAAASGQPGGQQGGAAGANGMTAVWAIPGAKSETVVHGGAVAFEVQFDGMAAAGANPDEYEPVLIRLTPSQTNFRLVGATSTNPSEFQNSQADWNLYSSFVEQRIPAQATKVGAGRYTLQTGAGLGAGEYGVVLRPVNKDKKFAWSSIGQNQGDGLIFNCVWSFEVQ